MGGLQWRRGIGPCNVLSYTYTTEARRGFAPFIQSFGHPLFTSIFFVSEFEFLPCNAGYCRDREVYLIS